MLVGSAVRRVAALLTSAVITLAMVGLAGGAHAAPVSSRTSASAPAVGGPTQTGRPQHAVAATSHHAAVVDVDLVAVLPGSAHPAEHLVVDAVATTPTSRTDADSVTRTGRAPPTR